MKVLFSINVDRLVSDFKKTRNNRPYKSVGDELGVSASTLWRVENGGKMTLGMALILGWFIDDKHPMRYINITRNED